MTMRLFSDRSRPVHLGPYPLERLSRRPDMPDLTLVPAPAELSFYRPQQPESLVNAMRDHQAMMDAIRDGIVNGARAEIPEGPLERANHLKAFGYFSDASMMGIGPLTPAAHLAQPRRNPDIDALSALLRTGQTKTLASGIDGVMADLRSALAAPPTAVTGHAHAIVMLVEYPRDPDPDEPGADWLADAQAHRACLRASECAVVLANYIRALGWDAKAHTATSTEVDLNRVTVAAGLATFEGGHLVTPYIGARFGIAAVTTDMALADDAPLVPLARQPAWRTRGPAWWLGAGFAKSARNHQPYARRRFVDGAHPFETLKRVDSPTTYIDAPNVARVPKRADMFARALFGDMGSRVQDGAKEGHYVRKSAPAMGQRRALGAFVLLQDGPPAPLRTRTPPADLADKLKAASYFLGADATGTSACPEWTWYSHDAAGTPIDPPHDHAISMVIDQGFETMEGASGDDWISVAQSMRAYLRFSLLGGVIAQQIRNLGYSAKAHTVLDGEVLQPPLLLLAGLGEVSRIGEVILNPFLGPRLKSGVVTTDLPLAHDKPIDFGLQRFCEACNKCARECPSGAITAGPKLMFNGYEIWKSDSQKCATYRITTPGGAMCGRCMKTCPWNLEGLFAEAPFRWAAMNLPAAAPVLARLDDAVGNGGLNDIKKWWWDIELQTDGGYRPTRHPVNRRDLQRDLKLDHADQTLAVYPAPLAPPPHPYPFPMDREAGIAAYRAMIPAQDYRDRLARGDTSMIHRTAAAGDTPVLPVVVTKVEKMTAEVSRFEFRAPDGSDLPPWQAGAHLDVVVAPEYLRQYSLSGDPADRSVYQIAVLREALGRGGSALLHRIFTEGRQVFVSRPLNHFPLVEGAARSLLMGGGIGIAPMIAMAHRLHALGAEFEVHYSLTRRAAGGFLDDLAAAPWADRVALHISEAGSRADLDRVLAGYRPGWHVYTCGPERYMNAVIEAATRQGFPDAARHLEYFSAPEVPAWENHAFTLKLARSGREFMIPADRSATDVLAGNGVAVTVKCSDGICGVCKCAVISGAVEHRDFVLSNAQRKDAMILCQSRAATPGGTVEIDL